MIDRDLAKEGAALISTAIGSLMEDAAAEAVSMHKGGWRLTVIKADKLKAVGSDVSGLAEAMRILARRSQDEPDAS